MTTAGTVASRPILQRYKDSMIQPTYYMIHRGLGHTVIRALMPRKE